MCQVCLVLNPALNRSKQNLLAYMPPPCSNGSLSSCATYFDLLPRIPSSSTISCHQLCCLAIFFLGRPHPSSLSLHV